jgi:hypothetical protein
MVTIWTTIALLPPCILFFASAGLAEVNFAVRLSDKYAVVLWLFYLFVGCAGLLSYVLRLKDKKWQSWPFLSQWPGWPTLPWGPELLNEAKTPKYISRSEQNYCSRC